MRLFGKALTPQSGDALAVLAKVDEESIVNVNSYVRGVLGVEKIEMSI